MLLADRTSCTAASSLPCLEDPARAAREAVGCAARNAHGQPRRCRRANSRVPATSPAVGARAAAPSARPPRYPKAHALGGNGHLSLLRGHDRRLLYSLRAALHLLRALPRLVQEALHVTGPADDLRRLRRARTGQHICTNVLGGVLGQLRAEMRAPRPLRL